VPVDNAEKINAKLKDALMPNKGSKFSKTSFVFVKGNGKYTAYISVLSADSAYSENGLEKFKSNGYGHMAANFGGSELYFTPKGNTFLGPSIRTVTLLH